MQEQLAEAATDSKQRVWIHCASMGEFEAIRPLARLLRERGAFLCISFLSTSGPKHLQGGVEADLVAYHPFDTPRSARRFVGLLKPDIVCVTKHDLWPNHLRQAKQAGAKLLFINANFHSRSRLTISWLKGFHRELLSLFDVVAPVSKVTAARFRDLLDELPIRIEMLGDSRYDRVLERANENDAHHSLPPDFREGTILVAGSTWEAGEHHLLPAFERLRSTYPELRLLLAPHDPSEQQLKACIKRLESLNLSWLRLADAQPGISTNKAVLLVDRVGLLAGLYHVGTIAYVGGGFTTGVHSVIEPAAHGLPVLFGPSHHVSQEADFLLKCGGGFEIGSDDDTYRVLLDLLSSAEARDKAGKAASSLVHHCTGASQRFLQTLDSLAKD